GLAVREVDRDDARDHDRRRREPEHDADARARTPLAEPVAVAAIGVHRRRRALVARAELLREVERLRDPPRVVTLEDGRERLVAVDQIAIAVADPDLDGAEQ